MTLSKLSNSSKPLYFEKNPRLSSVQKYFLCVKLLKSPLYCLFGDLMNPLKYIAPKGSRYHTAKSIYLPPDCPAQFSANSLQTNHILNVAIKYVSLLYEVRFGMCEELGCSWIEEVEFFISLRTNENKGKLVALKCFFQFSESKESQFSQVSSNVCKSKKSCFFSRVRRKASPVFAKHLHESKRKDEKDKIRKNCYETGAVKHFDAKTQCGIYFVLSFASLHFSLLAIYVDSSLKRETTHT